MTVAEKLVYILKDLFDVFDLKYVDQPADDDAETDSDNDYWSQNLQVGEDAWVRIKENISLNDV